MSTERKSIFDLADKFDHESPFDNWTKKREEQWLQEQTIRINRENKVKNLYNDFDKSASQFATSTYFRDKERRQYYLIRNVRVLKEYTVENYSKEEVVHPGSYFPPRSKVTRTINTKIETDFTQVIVETAILDIIGNLINLDDKGLPTQTGGTPSYLKEVKETKVKTTTKTSVTYDHNILKTFEHHGTPEIVTDPSTILSSSNNYSDSDWVYSSFGNILRNFDSENQGLITVHKDYTLSQAESVESQLRTIGLVANIIPGVGKVVSGAAKTMAALQSFSSKVAPMDATTILLYQYSVAPRKMHLKTWSYPTVDFSGNVISNDKYLKVVGSSAVPKGLLTDSKYLKYDKE